MVSVAAIGIGDNCSGGCRLLPLFVGDSGGFSVGVLLGAVVVVVSLHSMIEFDSLGRASLDPCLVNHSSLRLLMNLSILCLSSPFNSQWDQLFSQSSKHNPLT